MEAPLCFFRPQEDQRGAANFVTLLDTHLNVRPPPIVMSEQIPGQASIPAAGGGVLRDTVILHKYPNAHLILSAARLRAKNQNTFGPRRLNEFEVFLPDDFGAFERFKLLEGDED